MKENQANRRLLKAVPTPDPNSLTPEDRLLLLSRGNPSGGFRLECWPARPYLGVISNETPGEGPSASDVPPETPKA